MQTALRTTTRVLAGGHVTVSDPELKEGQTVEVIVLPQKHPPADSTAATKPMSMVEFLESLPPSRRTLAEWEEFDREFQRERDAWDR